MYVKNSSMIIIYPNCNTASRLNIEVSRLKMQLENIIVVVSFTIFVPYNTRGVRDKALQILTIINK